MASSVGPRAGGTDGSDFSHRETVARHYQKSAELKPKLRRILQLQMLSALVCLAVGLWTKYDFACLLSFSGYACGLPFGILAIKNNSHTYVNLYGSCCSLLGVFPMVYLLYLSLWTGAVNHHRFVRLGVAVMVIVLNTIGMFYAKTLMTTWSANTKKRK